MLMKRHILFFFLLLSAVSSFAQIENYAFKFTDSGSINCGSITSLNNKDTYTLQCWISPSVWTQGACIWKRGTETEFMGLKLGNEGTLIYKAGNQELPITSEALKTNVWTQITIMQSQEGINVWINNMKVISNATAMNIPASEADVEIGHNYTGRIDEIRFWNTNIDTNYLLWQNTVNSFHPNYQNLVAYYKGDQKNCIQKLYDYTNVHHGKLNAGVTREKVTDNPYFEYKILTAYTNITRFFDRNIQKENYLMANDIIILGIETNNKGEAYLSTPNNHATIINGTYLKDFKEHSGVLSLQGEGAQINAGLRALHPEDGWYKKKNQYSLLTWIYLEKWTQGAYLFRKERSATEGFSVRLGNEEKHELIVRLNGTDYIWKDLGTTSKPYLKTGEWMHIGISTSTASATSAVPGREKQLFRVGFNGKSRFPDEGPSIILDSDLSIYSDVPLIIGENLNAKLDQTTVWHRECSSDYMKKEMEEGMAMPSIGGYIDEVYAACATTYYQYDDPEWLGYDSFSTDEFIKIMRSAFEGRTGYTMRLGISGHDNWQNTLGDAAKREKMANQIKEIVDATKVDGVETDMEWAYSNPGVTNYSNLIALLKEKMPDKIVSSSPHAVAYNLNQNAIDAANRFSFQVYTNRQFFTMDGFKSAYNGIKNKYPKNKIVLSYGATTSTGSTSGVENGYRSVIGYDPRPDVTSITTPDGNNYLVCSVNQVKERAQFVIDNDLPGLMYWDMGNDLAATDELSLCRAVNFVMASNVDYLYTDENMPTGVEAVHQSNKQHIVYPNPVNDYFTCTLPNDERIVNLSIYTPEGKLITQKSYSEENSVTQNCQQLERGIYIISVLNSKGRRYSQNLIKR